MATYGNRGGLSPRQGRSHTRPHCRRNASSPRAQRIVAIEHPLEGGHRDRVGAVRAKEAAERGEAAPAGNAASPCPTEVGPLNGDTTPKRL